MWNKGWIAKYSLSILASLTTVTNPLQIQSAVVNESMLRFSFLNIFVILFFSIVSKFVSLARVKCVAPPQYWTSQVWYLLSNIYI